MYLFLLVWNVCWWFFINFTFHNVSISTLSFTLTKKTVNALHSTMYLFLPFTACTPSTSCRTLHSTMYLFLPWSAGCRRDSRVLLYIPQCIYFYVWNADNRQWFAFFTFHNVSISTMLLWWSPAYLHSLHSTMYLFLPKKLRDLHHFCYKLYIPQCIYFYSSVAHLVSTITHLYIPQCIYFYWCRISYYKYVYALYIPQCIYFYPESHVNLKWW